MPNLVFDTTDSITHATSDNNVLTEVSSGVLQKTLFGDVFGEALDAHWTPGTVRGHTENGTLTESGGVLGISVPTASGYHGKGVFTPYVMNDGTWSVEFTIPASDAADKYVGLYLYVNATNWVTIDLRFWTGGTGDRYTAARMIGGSYAESYLNLGAGGATRTPKFKITRSGNYFKWYYDNGAGWVNLRNETLALGANLAAWIGCVVNTTGVNVTADNFVSSGTGYFWDTIPVPVFAVENVGAGSTIQCGSASGTFDVTTTIDLKFGTGAWITNKTLTEIQALGNQTTDNGNVQIRTNHGNMSGQSTFTSLTLPYAVAGGGLKGLRGVQRNIGPCGIKSGLLAGAA